MTNKEFYNQLVLIHYKNMSKDNRTTEETMQAACHMADIAIRGYSTPFDKMVKESASRESSWVKARQAQFPHLQDTIMKAHCHRDSVIKAAIRAVKDEDLKYCPWDIPTYVADCGCDVTDGLRLDSICDLAWPDELTKGE